MKKIIQGEEVLLLMIIVVILSGCSIEDVFNHQITQYIAVKRGTGGYNVEKARQEGVPDQQIAEYLASTRNYDLGGALRNGYSYKEVIDYLAPQAPQKGTSDKTWKLSHKIAYKVYPDKQHVVYWIQSRDDKERSRLYTMKKCTVANSNNWEGEMDYHSPFWPTRVEVINGEFKFDGIDLPHVGWWKWNFDEESFQRSKIISTTWFVWNNNLVWTVLGIGILLVCMFGISIWIEEKKERQEARQAERARKRGTAEWRPKMADPRESLG